MATIEYNEEMWDKSYKWINHGEEWSQGWGGSDMQWFGMILPRIKNFLPAKTILEIAPGHGRWTEFLLNYAEKLQIVDLSKTCIEECKKRFETKNNIDYYVNDGKSLNMIEDGAIDFVFSFDSLVHVEEEVIDSYLNGLSRKLSQNGVGFIHHSNMEEYSSYFKAVRKIPRGRGILSKIGLIESKEHLRAHSMSALKFDKLCEKYSLKCIGQEVINWDSKRLIDSISIFCRESSKWNRPNVVLRNQKFSKEERIHINKMSNIYGIKSFYR